MITSEMRNSMLRDMVFNDLADIKKQLEELKKELATLKEMICPTLN